MGRLAQGQFYPIKSIGNGGDEGIRTLERLHVTPLAGERLRPLGHVSAAVSMDQATEKQALSPTMLLNFASACFH